MGKEKVADKSGVERVLKLLLEDTKLPSASDEGGFWWIPLPADQGKAKSKTRRTSKSGSKPTTVRWVLLPLLASEWESTEWETLHPHRWFEVKQALAILWKMPNLVQELVGCHNGLPRGRVAIHVCEEGEGYLIDSGSNNPPGTSMLTVAEKFGIQLGGPNRIDD